MAKDPAVVAGTGARAYATMRGIWSGAGSCRGLIVACGRLAGGCNIFQLQVDARFRGPLYQAQIKLGRRQKSARASLVQHRI